MKTTITLRILMLAFVAAFLFTSCNKKGKENEKRANEFKSFTTAKKFKIVSFYADKPVDYEDDDMEVKQETELWPYVKEYIRDDENRVTDNGEVHIDQMAIKYAGHDESTLIRPFKVLSDRTGTYLEFVDYFYQPLRYKLLEFKENYFIIYIDFRGGAKIYSKYVLVP
jgi:hypothetical protein